MTARRRIVRFALSGAVAGVAATLVFTAVHQVLISDIWFSFVPMAVAGAICGSTLGATYALLVDTPSVRGWIGFNAVYVGLFVALAVASVVVFEPITTAAAVLAANEPPEELFARSLPFMAVFTLVATGVLALVYGRRPHQVIALLVTTVVLMAALGMNVGIFGLVEIPTSALPLIGMLFALIAVLATVYAAVVALLERRAFASGTPRPAP